MYQVVKAGFLEAVKNPLANFLAPEVAQLYILPQSTH
jgi:hypothetical protein